MILFHSPSDKGKSVSRNTGFNPVQGCVLESKKQHSDDPCGRGGGLSQTKSASRRGSSTTGAAPARNPRGGLNESAQPVSGESDSFSTFKSFRYGGVLRLNDLVEYIQAMKFRGLWRTAAVMLAIVEATSIQKEDGRFHVKHNLEAAGLRLIQTALNTSHDPVCRPLLGLISQALKQGPAGIEAAHKTAALFLYFGCRIRPRTELLIGDGDETSLNRIELPDLCDRVAGIDLEIEPVPDPWQRYPEYGLGSSQEPPSQTCSKLKNLR